MEETDDNKDSNANAMNFAGSEERSIIASRGRADPTEHDIGEPARVDGDDASIRKEAPAVTEETVEAHGGAAFVAVEASIRGRR